MDKMEQNYKIEGMNKRGIKKFYRIIEEPVNVNLSALQDLVDSKQLETFTKTTLQEHRWFYFDFNEQAGMRLMNECESSDDEEEVQKIGGKFTVNLNCLTSKNAKGLSYLFKTRQQSRKKERALSFLKEELKRSTENIQNCRKLSMRCSRLDSSSGQRKKSINLSGISTDYNTVNNDSPMKPPLLKKPILKGLSYIQPRQLERRARTTSKKEKSSLFFTQALPAINKTTKTNRL